MNQQSPRSVDEPSHLFISYARADAEVVMDDVDFIEASGFPIWYDMLTPGGAVWREELARRIGESVALVCFMSSHSLASKYCTQELTFAVDEGKPLICVHLEPLVLTPGLRMTVGDRQALLRYELVESQYRARLTLAIKHAFDPASHTQLPNTEILPETLLLEYEGRRSVVPFAFSGAYEVGRSPSCQLSIDSSFISRRHGHFKSVRSTFRYRDYSVNGTILATSDGERLIHGAEVELPNSGALRIGDKVIRFKVVAPQPPTQSDHSG